MKLKKKDLTIVKRLLEEGVKSLQEIASLFSVEPTAIWYYKKTLGIKIKSHKQKIFCNQNGYCIDLTL